MEGFWDLWILLGSLETYGPPWEDQGHFWPLREARRPLEEAYGPPWERDCEGTTAASQGAGSAFKALFTLVVFILAGFGHFALGRVFVRVSLV